MVQKGNLTPEDEKKHNSKKVTFPGRAGFYTEVKNRVSRYFEETGKSKNADWRMVLKTVVILSWTTAAYAWFLMAPPTLLWAIGSAALLAQGFVLIGFNVMHDGAHGSYSKNARVNWFMSMALDLIGGSNLLWRHKHNILHHTFTNINDVDDDLSVPGILRFSPDQPWRPVHRFQHWYAFPSYGIMTLLWVLSSDFQKYFSRKIGDYRLPKPPRVDSILFFTTKVFYFGYMLVLPMFFHPVLHVLLFFLVLHVIVGLSIATVFQLAHIVEGNSFPRPDPSTGEIDNEWAIHQVETTADFSPASKIVTWYCGGLNFQIEHHLFPKVCHIHYPVISKIVRETCRDYQVAYVSYRTLGQAIASHFRFLRTLGRKSTGPMVPAPQGA